MKYEFKKGDKVTYRSTPTPGTDFNRMNAGKTATVRQDVSTDSPRTLVGVRLDSNGNEPQWYAQNCVKIPTQEEIDAALKVLENAGDVTFKPHKPAFDVRTVNGLGSYSAKISNKDITVGCTTISFEKFDEIAAYVAEARQYNAE